MLVTLLLLSAVPIGATVISLKVTLEDGSVAVYQLRGDTSMNFSDGEIVISDSSSDIRIPLDNTLKWEYEVNLAGITNDATDYVSINFEEDILKISGLPKGKSISIYSIDGTSLYSAVAKGESINVPTVNWPKGVYVVKHSGTAVKIAKR